MSLFLLGLCSLAASAVAAGEDGSHWSLRSTSVSDYWLKPGCTSGDQAALKVITNTSFAGCQQQCDLLAECTGFDFGRASCVLKDRAFAGSWVAASRVSDHWAKRSRRTDRARSAERLSNSSPTSWSRMLSGLSPDLSGNEPTFLTSSRTVLFDFDESSPHWHVETSRVATVIEETSEKNSELSSAVAQAYGVAGSGPAFAGSVEASVGSTASKTFKSTTLLHTSYYSTEKVKFDEIFLASALPDKIFVAWDSFVDGDKYEDFALQFGQFYAPQMYLGGSYKKQVSATWTADFDSTHFSTAVGASAQSIPVDTEVVEGPGGEASFSFSNDKTRESADAQMKTKIVALGGDPTVWATGGSGAAEKWQESIDDSNKQPVSYVLSPIWQLVQARGALLEGTEWQAVGRKYTTFAGGLKLYLEKQWNTKQLDMNKLRQGVGPSTSGPARIAGWDKFLGHINSRVTHYKYWAENAGAGFCERNQNWNAYLVYTVWAGQGEVQGSITRFHEELTAGLVPYKDYKTGVQDLITRATNLATADYDTFETKMQSWTGKAAKWCAIGDPLGLVKTEAFDDINKELTKLKALD